MFVMWLQESKVVVNYKFLQHTLSTPFRVSLLYILFAASWIVISGYLLRATVADPLLQNSVELVKGLTFVAVTGGLLYLLLKSWSNTMGGTPSVSATAIDRPKKYLLLITLILLVLIVPVMDISIYELRLPASEHDTYGNLAAIAELKAHQIEQWVAERSGDAKGLADNTGFAMQLESFESSSHNSRDVFGELKSMHTNHGFDTIMLYSAEGRMMSSMGSDTDKPPESLMRRALSESRVIISDLYLNPSDNHIHLDWIVPIIATGHHGKHAVGLVVLRTMPGKFLYPLIQSWPVKSDSGEVLLVRSDGTDVLFLDPLRFDQHAALTRHGKLTDLDLPAAIAIHANKPGTTAGLDYRQVPVLSAYRPVSGTAWYLIAKLDRGEVMQPLRYLLYWVSGVGTVAVFAIMAMLTMLLRQLQRTQLMALRSRYMEVIEESERRFRAVAQSANDAIITADSNGKVVEINRSAEKMFGYAQGEIKGQSLPILMPDGFCDLDRLGMARLVVGGEPHMIGHTVEQVGRGKDGSRFPLEMSLAKWDALDGQYYTAIIRDISERKQTQEKMVLSETRYRRLFEAAKDGILILDAETGKIMDVNPYMCEMLGFSHREFLGKRIWELGFFKDKLANQKNFAELQQEEYVRYEDLPLETADGKRFHVEFVSNVYLVDGIKIIQCNIRDITQRRTNEKRIIRLTQLYAALSECNQAILHCSSEEELFQIICRTIVEFGGMRMAWVGLVDEASRKIKPVASYGEISQYLAGIEISLNGDDPTGRGPTGTSIRENRAYWCQDIQQDPNMDLWHERGLRFGVKSSAALPLCRKGTPVGSLSIYSDVINVFDEETCNLLKEMAADISFALDNFANKAERLQGRSEILYKNTVLQTQQETSLDAILIVDENGKIISYNHQFINMWGLSPQLVNACVDEPVLQAVVDQVENPEAFVARVQYLYEHRDEKSRDEINTADGRIIDRYSAPVIGDEGKYYGRVWYFREITESRRASQELADSEQRFRGLVEQSVAGVLIIQDNKLVYVNPRCAEIIGQGSANEFISHDPLDFVAEADRGKVAEAMRKLLEKVAHSIALDFSVIHKDGSEITVGANANLAIYHGHPAIIGLVQDISDKKRHEESILNYVAQLKATFMSTVQLATSLSEMRDPYTAGHERRVSDIAVAIATEMGLDEQRIEGIRVAGFLHDIGKISIPAEILVKPGRLTPTEYALVQGHAQASYDVLKHVAFPWPVATVALQHHERMDGSGYPNGLKGDELLLESRIMAVADVVEAMASHRPYRAGLGIEKALAEIERGRGTAYDPAVVDTCLSMFREHRFELPPH